MPTLTIDLQDGFDGDRAEIWVDGDKLWEADEVTTNLSVSLAASVPLQVEPRETTVRLVLPSRQLEAELQLVVSADTYVAANLDGSGTRLEELAERPYYL